MFRLFKGVCLGASAALVIVFFISVQLPDRTARQQLNVPGRRLSSSSSSSIINNNLHSRRAAADRELGYFFALKYYEQQTQATKNFLQMQCLADSYGMQVVEPFAVESQISFPFTMLAKGENLLPFGEVMDMNLMEEFP